MKCIIPCAGENSRMCMVPKFLLLVRGKPLLHYVTEAWAPSVDSFVFVLKRAATYLWEYLPQNSAIVFQEHPLGLADAILRAKEYVLGRFVISLGDCIFSGAFDVASMGTDLGVGVWMTNDEDEFRKSYAVEIEGAYVVGVHEKPKELLVKPLPCGMGVYFLDDRVFSYIERTQVSPGGGDFTEVLQAMIDAGEKIRPVYFQGQYVNVGSPEDINKAEGVLSD